MRPVNLIPSDQRRGDGAPARAGAASYILLAVLLAAVFAVTGVVLTGNDVKEKESELASLEATQAQTQARAEALASFASFQGMKDARVETVTSLAQSRFNWQRVMRELSLLLPDTVWLTNVTGTVSPEVTVQKTANLSTRASVTGPALALIGCARSQQDVAKLIAAIGDIDGVTRVLVERSEKPTSEVTTGATEGVNEDCRTRSYIAKFQLVAAFDDVVTAASAPPAATPAPTDPSATATATGAEAATASAPADASTAVPQEAEAQANVDSGTARAKKAAGLVGAGDGG
jgi:Tfp pilus assembly protein PilN